ncbi:MAG: coproporphyrinogen III oxidase, partial [Aliarcobacter butzleri]
EEFKINFKEYFDDAIKALKEFEDAQLLKITDNKIEVSQTGSMLIRNICMPFDAYLNKIPEEKRRFSKTI